MFQIPKGDKQESPKKNEQNLSQEGEAGKNEIENTSLHVMPKLKSSKAYKPRSQVMGFIVVLFGVILFGLACFFAYYFFTKERSGLSSIDNNSEINLKNLGSDLNVPNKPKSREPVPAEAPVEIPEIATSTDSDATSTEDLIEEINIASSTDNIISEEDIIAGDTESDLIKDSDGDGLTDGEEALLGTISVLSDSDNDGFNDLDEVLSLNNPIGEGIMVINSKIKKYQSSLFNYSFFYPVNWTYSVLSENNSVIFKISDEKTIQVIAAENPDNLNISEWYGLQVSVKPILPGQRISKNGWSGIMSEDGNNLYLSHPASSRIFVLFYNDPEMRYKNIFQLVINSFEVKND